MTAALAPRTGLPGELRDNAYILPPDLSLDEWGAVLRLADHIVAASPWWLVDTMAYGEAKWGEMHAQALPGPQEDPYGASRARMTQAAWMGRVYPPCTRVQRASYTHHRIAADLPGPDRQRMLREVAEAAQAVEDGIAGAEPISTRELGRRVKVRKEHLAGTAVSIDGTMLESVALPLTKEDLTDDARAALEVRLSEMGARMRPGFEAGFVAGLIWSGVPGAFKEGRA
jgi:hypothetical protein